MVGCGCAACESGQPQLIPDAQDYQDFSTTSSPDYAPSGDADPNDFANYLTHGYWQDTGRSNMNWAKNDLTYSISIEFTAAQKAGLKMAFDLWADVADITFTEVTNGADIQVLEGDDGRAYSQSGTIGSEIVNNKISIDTAISSWRNFDDLGDYALMTALHEIGHSLGLGHTGNYNGSGTYNNDAQWTNDTHQMTVMSYFQDTNVGSDHWNSTNVWQYSATPMLIDILAIQNIYGANNTTRLGDTTYGFNSNAGRDQFDFTIDEVPIAIWDAGGIDTLDLSGYSTDQIIHLEEGQFSSTGSMTNNIVIAYGTVIENAIGGSRNDRIYGNNAQNTLLGGLGDDIFFDSLGDDTISGGNGSDTLSLNYSINDFAYNFIDNVTVAITNLIHAYTDTISNIENFIFTDASHSFAELKALFGNLGRIGGYASFTGSDRAYFSSDQIQDFNMTSTDFNLAGPSSNMLHYDHSSSGMTITLLNNSQSGQISITSFDDNDNITIYASGGSLSSVIRSRGGDDIITINNTALNNVHLGDGNDILHGGQSIDMIFGENGNDIINGRGGNDKLYGGAGDDILNGDEGNDFLFGDEGNDTLNGGFGYDTLRGEEGDDILNGGDGNDRLIGGNDNDTLNGGNHNDLLYGNFGDDTLNGDDGKDRLYGGSGNDVLHGGEGNDQLYAHEGLDILIGGEGRDFLDGGADADLDIFGFSADENAIDTINNFVLGIDQINITDLLTGYNHGISDILDFVQIDHVDSRFDVLVDRNGGADNFVKIAEVYTDINDALDAQDLIDTNTLIANQTLI